MQLTYFGHATVGIDLAGIRLLTDPVLRGHVAFLRRIAPAPRCELLRDVNAVLISHLHHDHCDPASLALLGRNRTLVVPWGADAFFRRRHFTHVVPLRPGETHAIGAVSVTATEAAHNGRREPFGPRGLAVGYQIAAAGERIYFAGDTDLYPAMHDLRGLDVALLPVAGWGRTLGPGHLDPVRAAEAVRVIGPALAVPIHWAGLQPFWYRTRPPDGATTPAAAFAEEVGRQRLPTEVAVVQPGESVIWRATGTLPSGGR